MPDWLFDPIVAASLLMLVYSAGFSLLAIVAAAIDALRQRLPRNSLRTIRRINRPQRSPADVRRQLRQISLEEAARRVR